MRKTTLIVLFLLIALVATIGSVSAANSKTVFRTLLSAVPGLDSDAHGNAVFQFADDGSQLSYKLVVNGLDNTTMAHIHVAVGNEAPCSFNPPVLWLYPAGPPPAPILGTFNGLLGGRKVTSGDLFQPAAGSRGINSLDDLRNAIEDGRAYVLVHTTQNQPGEICGVIQ